MKKEKEKRKTKDSTFLKAQREQKEIPLEYHHRSTIETIRGEKNKGYTVVELENSIPYVPSYNCREGVGTVAVRRILKRWSETYFLGWFVFSSDELCVFLYHRIKPSERMLRFNRLVFFLY